MSEPASSTFSARWSRRNPDTTTWVTFFAGLAIFGAGGLLSIPFGPIAAFVFDAALLAGFSVVAVKWWLIRPPGLLTAIFGSASLALVFAVLCPIYLGARSASKTTTTLSNAKRTVFSLLEYAGDHDDRLPLAGNWMDACTPYVHDPEIFRNPMCEGYGNPEIYGFAFNSAFARISTATPAHPDETILIFGTKSSGRNAAGPLSQIRELELPESRNVYGFLSGRAKFMASRSFTR